MSTVADLEFLKLVVTDAQIALHEEKQNFVNVHSKLKIGDIVKVTGWTHTGKSMVVEKIFFSEASTNAGCGIVATGSVLRKDETKSLYTGSHLELEVKLNH